MPADTPLAEAAKDTPAIPKAEAALPKGPPFEARFARAMVSLLLGPTPWNFVLKLYSRDGPPSSTVSTHFRAGEQRACSACVGAQPAFKETSRNSARFPRETVDD